MPSITKDILQQKYGETELLNRLDPKGLGEIDDDLLHNHIVAVTAVIEGYVRKIYPNIIISDVPLLVNAVAAPMVRHAMYVSGGAPDYIIKDAERAMQILRDIANGKIRLFNDAGDTKTTPTFYKGRNRKPHTPTLPYGVA